jgi:hypothetical protein
MLNVGPIRMWDPKGVSRSLSYGWSSSCDDDEEEEELDLARWELDWEFGGDQSGGAGGWLDSVFFCEEGTDRSRGLVPGSCSRLSGLKEDSVPLSLLLREQVEVALSFCA